MNADREHHDDMYVGVEFEFEKCPALSLFWISGVFVIEFPSAPPSLDHSDQCFPPSELAGILCLNSLVVHHLRVIQLISLQ